MLLLKINMNLLIKQIALTIDIIIYNAITWMYSVFMSIAGARIFSSDLITEFTNRVYLMLSIVMLFVVAYSFMTVIINPDNMTKGNSSPVKIVTNIVLSLVIIVIVPSAFSFGYAFQRATIRENVLGKLILGTKAEVDVDDFDQGAANFSITLFETNFYIKPSAPYNMSTEDFTNFKNAFETRQMDARTVGSIQPFYDEFFSSADAITTTAYDLAEEAAITKPSTNVLYAENIQYNYFLCGIVGIFVLYVLLSFSIDMGFRVIKLFFLQMVAPIPALLMIIPGRDKIMKSWVKETLKTYFDVFIKITIIMFGIFIINVVGDLFENGQVVGFESSNNSVIVFAKLFIYLGVILFMKRAPKLIEDVFGFKLDENGLSLGKRLREVGQAITHNPVADFANKVGGAVAGYNFAKRASRIGEKVRGKRQNALQNFMTGAGGIVNGYRGGLRNSGYAFDYEMTNQQWYTSPEYENMKGGKRLAGGIANRLRNNFGGPSIYTEKEAAVELDYNYQTGVIDRDLSSMRNAADKRINAIGQKHDPVIQRNAAYSKSIKDIEDHCNAKVQKPDSKIKIGGIMKPKYNSALKAWTFEAVKGDLNYSSIEAINKNINDIKDIDPKMREQVVAANTKQMKELGSLYKKSVDDGTTTDVELENLESTMNTVIKNYQGLLGRNAEGNDTGKGTYTVIDAASDLKDLHKKLEDIERANASGAKELEMSSNAPEDLVEWIDSSGHKHSDTLFTIKQKETLLEDKKKQINEAKAAEQMALSGYKRMDERMKKGFYKGKPRE